MVQLRRNYDDQEYNVVYLHHQWSDAAHILSCHIHRFFPPLQFFPPLVGGGSLTRGEKTWGGMVFLKVFIDLGAEGAHPQFFPPLVG